MRHRSDADAADPERSDTADDVAAQFQAEITRALADVRRTLGTEQISKRTPLFLVDAVTLLKEEATEPHWLVTGLITRGGIAVIGGVPKAAKKTWLGTEIAAAVAAGEKVCGEFPAEAGTVVYFYAEDTRRQVRNRLRAVLAGANRTMPPGRLHLEPRGSFLDVTREQDLAWIVASCRKLGKVDLLVLDPLRDVHSGEEDKSDSMREVMRRLRLLGELLDCTVLVVHHAGKPSEATAKRGGGQRLRGSGAIHGSVDAGIYFLDCRGDGVRTVRATWSVTRDAGAEKLSAKAVAVAAKSDRDAADHDKVLAFVRRLAGEGIYLTRRALRDHDERPIAVNRVTAALDRLIEVGQLSLVGAEVHLPQQTRAGRS